MGQIEELWIKDTEKHGWSTFVDRQEEGKEKEQSGSLMECRCEFTHVEKGEKNWLTGGGYAPKVCTKSIWKEP